MYTEFIFHLLAYTIPSLVTAGLGYLVFTKFINKQNEKDAALLQKLNTKSTIDTKALKLQALERFIILIDRIDVKNLVLRINPVSEDKSVYTISLIKHIEQEFDYNISQQIYISEELWSILLQTKNDVLEYIQTTINLDAIQSTSQLRQYLIANSMTIENKVNIARKAIKLEANTITH